MTKYDKIYVPALQGEYWLADQYRGRTSMIEPLKEVYDVAVFTSAEYHNLIHKQESSSLIAKVTALTDGLATKVAALQEIVKASQHIKDNPNCAYILKIAENAFKNK